MNPTFVKFFLGILTAATIALGGWMLGIDRAVASQQTLNEDIVLRLDRIQNDIREIRQYLFRSLPPGGGR